MAPLADTATLVSGPDTEYAAWGERCFLSPQPDKLWPLSVLALVAATARAFSRYCFGGSH